MGWGKGMGTEGDGCVRQVSHQRMSSWVLRGGVCRRKGLSPKMGSIALRFIRYGQPSGKTSDAWISLPSNFWALLRVCVRHALQSFRATMYLAHLVSARHTMQSVRFQVRPMKVGWSEKGMSFEISQGTPRLPDTWLMSLML